MAEGLRQVDFEELSAWCDGELDAERAAAVEARVTADPAWRRAHEQLVALNRALDAWTVEPCEKGLDEQIMARLASARRPRPRVLRLVTAGAAAAAAAAALLAVVLTHKPRQPSYGRGYQAGPRVAAVLKDVPRKDLFLVENLDFFEDYEVVSNYETLEALDRLETTGGGS